MKSTLMSYANFVKWHKIGIILFIFPAFSTQNFPSMDTKTLTLCFDYEHNELGRALALCGSKAIKYCSTCIVRGFRE